MPYIIILVFVLSIIFFILGYLSKREWNEGDASINISIGILLLIVDVILFLIMISSHGMLNKQSDEGMNFIISSFGYLA